MATLSFQKAHNHLPTHRGQPEGLTGPGQELDNNKSDRQQ